ncbi:RNase HII [Motilibacter peucedani]|uniref:Ribonuclease HII n=1 Tax=Motilibacter peucedani TaxID=598650 RepID=A0A420XR80_9ACTN|nr:ribonuclease HII [Motilibacter peucedani]RKS77352.1 RNase HII [Motilibacter peucedani]
MSVPPSLRYEREAWRSGAGLLAAVDEVGRGSLAGPVSVGVVLLEPGCKPGPVGLRDSKLLTPEARTALVPRIRRWVLEGAVGHASAAEIDAVGILRALRLAAERAVASLSRTPDWVLLDGNHDYLTRRPQPLLLEFDDGLDALAAAPELEGGWRCEVPVRTLVKADLKCSSVAAASVLAKTERDALMAELAASYPAYGWDSNRGYSAPAHLAALEEHGPCEQHRRSWRLPGQRGPADELAADELPGWDTEASTGEVADEREQELA